RDNDVAVINLPNGFTFPFVTRLATQLSVSTNGFVAVGTGAGAAATNLDLSDPTYAGPALIAPFWDDLDLGAQGRVLWNLDEALYPRRLTIQWDKVRKAGAMGSELTFQVQLYETGEFLFAWKKLDGPGGDGSEATIGAVDGVDAYQGQVSFNSATSAELAVDTDRSWFNNQPELASTRQYRLRGFSSLGFVLELQGEYVPVYGRARAFGANDVIVSEAMPAPLPAITEGQWVELENPQPTELDVSGLRLETVSGATMPFVLPADTVIDAGAFFVLGQSTDPVANGDAGVRLAWSMGTVNLSTPDAVRLVVPTVQADGGTLVVSRLAWGAKAGLLPDGGAAPDAGVAEGTSVQPPENVLVRSGAPPFSCPRTGTFGPPTQFGTPGAANEQCFPYILSEIPVDFEDVSSGPSVAFPGNDDSATQVPLPAPFSYFGQTFSQIRVCTNGWISFVDTSSSSLSNKGLPSASAPIQTLAVFWDDLIIRNTSTTGAYVARTAGKTIIQYKNFEGFGATGDNLNFEIKLFDNGVIEYHYGSMVGPRADGNSATRWIDNLDGTAALAISVRTFSASETVGPLAVPNTAFRFTPRAAPGSTP
ncbi:MAG: lamin tail domain-containing protein, partial [Myxococcaceae bacterium]|nr:lamin tail domain-containing protein [Myxococcaceae bacterium]